jgi:hypothetical protein
MIATADATTAVDVSRQALENAKRTFAERSNDANYKAVSDARTAVDRAELVLEGCRQRDAEEQRAKDAAARAATEKQIADLEAREAALMAETPGHVSAIVKLAADILARIDAMARNDRESSELLSQASRLRASIGLREARSTSKVGDPQRRCRILVCEASGRDARASQWIEPLFASSSERTDASRAQDLATAEAAAE